METTRPSFSTKSSNCSCSEGVNQALTPLVRFSRVMVSTEEKPRRTGESPRTARRRLGAWSRGSCGSCRFPKEVGPYEYPVDAEHLFDFYSEVAINFAISVLVTTEGRSGHAELYGYFFGGQPALDPVTT